MKYELRIMNKDNKKEDMKNQQYKNTYQIDQSGKIEQTNIKTVIAAANGEIKAVIIPAKEKRKLQEIFRRIGKTQLFIDAVFSVALYFLFKQLNKSASVVNVDTEYPGHTEIIYKMISKLSKREISINWVFVGKSSVAHEAGYRIYKEKLKIGRVLTFEDIAERVIKIAGGYLNAGLSPANRHSDPANRNNISKKRNKVKTHKKR